MELKFKKTDPRAEAPRYATDGSACIDLAAIDGGVVRPGGSKKFATGLSFEIPRGFVMLIFSRSGHGFKQSVRLSNCVGVVDSDYRGEVSVSMHNDGATCASLVVAPGDRIAQAMLVPIPALQLVEAGELSTTERGEGGYGSTGR